MGRSAGEASRRGDCGGRRSSSRGSKKEKIAEDSTAEPRPMNEWRPSAAWDPMVLTIDPNSHLSHRATSGIKDESVKGYGGVISVKNVWEKVPESVKAIVKDSCFGSLLQMALSHEENRRVIVRGLIELFWDTTNTFHMPHFEMMVTPLDFSMLTGVLFGGDDVIYDRNFGNDLETLRDMYGELASEFLEGESRNISYSVFSTVFDNDKLLSVLSPDQLARCFLTYLLSSTIFADKSNKTWFHYLPCLRDLRRMGEYNWGGAGYANFIQHLRRACRVNDASNFEHYSQVTIGGLWNILEVWFYEYFPAYSPGSTTTSVTPVPQWLPQTAG